MKNNQAQSFKVTLSDRNVAVRGRPFRNIVIAAEDSLYALAEISIEAVFHTPKQKMLLLFDYGDEWHFIVQYLGTIEVSPGQKLPMIMESNGEVPNQYGGFGDEEEFEDEDE